MTLRGSWDGHDPRFLGEQPGERDLRGCRLLSFCELGEPLDERQIRLPVLRREARDHIAEVRAVERGLLVDLSRQEAFAERTERNEADSQFLERRQHLFLGLSPPE